MKIIPAAVFDRIEYSFGLLKNNFTQIFLPLFLFYLVAKLGAGTLLTFIALQYIDIVALVDAPGDMFLNLWTDPSVIIMIVISIALFLGYVLLIIPFIIATIQAIKNAYHGVNGSLGNNLSYGFKTFFSILGVYWHIFAYVALIPALLFIVGGLILIAGLFQNNEALMSAGGIISGLSALLFIIFSVYRGIKATFGLYQAVENDSFDKKSFMISVAHSDGRWWRVFGNIFLLGIILAIIVSIIGMVINLIFISIGGGFTDVVNNIYQEQNSVQELTLILQNIASISLGDILKSFLFLIINVTQTVCMMTFIYVLYQRLALEDSSSSPQEKQTIEL